MMLATTINEALREVVQALGGARKVGVMMRPEKSAKDAARWISDCLNVERREKFDPEQVMWLLREGRNIGCHSAMYFVGRGGGYGGRRARAARRNGGAAAAVHRCQQGPVQDGRAHRVPGKDHNGAHQQMMLAPSTVCCTRPANRRLRCLLPALWAPRAVCSPFLHSPL